MGLVINPVYDANALAAPQSFRTGVQTAINLIEAAFTNPITINITVGYGEINGSALPNQNTSEGGFSGPIVPYASLRTDLINSATSAQDMQSVATLPNTSSIQGQSSFLISRAQEKLFGLLAPNASGTDGEVGFGTNFTGNVLIAGALHEITHAMARVAGSSLDLFRFNENHGGNRVFGGSTPATPAYFSIDGGATDLADFGISSDPGDFLNPPGSNLTPNDPFNEIVGNIATLTPVDLTIMDVLGFTRAIAGGDTVLQAMSAYSANPNLAPVSVADVAANVASGLDGLQVLAAHGKLASITLTDPPDAVVVSQAQVSADAATLALIGGPVNLGVVASGAFIYTLAANVAGLTVSSESSSSIVGNASFNTINLGSGSDTVQAGSGGSYIVTNGGNDVLFGGAGGGVSGGGNTIYANGGNSFIQGGSGSPSDVLVATGSGNDTIYGGSGNNYVVGGTGQNTIVGGGGALQSLYGNGSAGDYIVGGSSPTASNVLVENGTGAASLWGGPGNNYEVGGPANDLMVGGNSSDYLSGGAGADTIYGGNGTDFIYPGAGNDFIWTDNIGSQSTDYIYEGVGSGVDTVADFTPGNGANHDVLVMTAAGSNLKSFTDVQAKALQVGVYTVLPLSATDEVFLYNVQPFQLTANDFSFQ